MKKNIVVLISDQMQKRAVLDDKRCIMPNLRRLQEDSVTMENAHAVNAICSPSRASLISGLLPHNHGMVDCTHTVPAYRADFSNKIKTMPEALKDEGYHLAYYGKWHIERTYDLSRYGFEDYETEKTIKSSKLTSLGKVQVKTDGYKDYTLCGVYKEGEEASEEHFIYSKAIDFIDKVKDDERPFCVFASTYAPHDPYFAPNEIFSLYDENDFPLPSDWNDHVCKLPDIYSRLHSVWRDLSESDLRKAIMCYYACCTLVDKQVGKLVSYLKEKGIYDDTLIVFLSDHGDMCGSHGLFCKGVPAYEEVYNIPLVMKFPENRYAGVKETAYVDTCDIMPTIFESCGINWLANRIDGSSFIPYLTGSKNRHDSFTVSEFLGQRYSYTQRIVWHKGIKYVFNAFSVDELYDLNKDPLEKENLVDDSEYADVKHEICKLLWDRVVKTDDWSFRDAQYCMHRILPSGPNLGSVGKGFALYNKTM